MFRLNTNPVIIQFYKKFYEKGGEAKRFGRIILINKKLEKQELVYGMRQIQSNLIKAVLDGAAELF